MYIKVFDSTDHKFIGVVAPLPVAGEKLQYKDYLFDIVDVTPLGNGIYKVWSYNYIILCKEYDISKLKD